MIDGTVSAVRFLCLVTLKRPDLAHALVIMRYRRKLPDVQGAEEAARLLEAAPGPKYQAAVGVAHGAGLPVGYFHVVFTLPVEVADIASQNKAFV